MDDIYTYTYIYIYMCVYVYNGWLKNRNSKWRCWNNHTSKLEASPLRIHLKTVPPPTPHAKVSFFFPKKNRRRGGNSSFRSVQLQPSAIAAPDFWMVSIPWARRHCSELDGDFEYLLDDGGDTTPPLFSKQLPYVFWRVWEVKSWYQIDINGNDSMTVRLVLFINVKQLAWRWDAWHFPRKMPLGDAIHRCPFPIGWLMRKEGLETSPITTGSDDRWYTSHRPNPIFTKRTLLCPVMFVGL